MRLLPNLFQSALVAGRSMSPALSEGDWLLFRKLPAGWSNSAATKVARVKVERAHRLIGRIILLERAAQPGIYQIKRVMRSDRDEIWVEGDNKSASTDSRNWGPISTSEVRGVYLFRYKKGKSRVD